MSPTEPQSPTARGGSEAAGRDRRPLSGTAVHVPPGTAQLSIDVFDTCLVRTYAMPRDVFYDLGLRVLSDPTPAAASEFAQARVAAERRARRASKSEDIGLDEVYDAFHELDAWGLERAAVRMMELEIEGACLRPVAEMRTFIGAARAAGLPVAFVSDMYLPTEFIAGLLKRFGFMAEGDVLLVSGEQGVTKRSGRLFEVLKRRTGVGYRHMLHIGDDVRGDVSVPRRLGLRTRRFRGTSFNRYETALLTDSLASPWITSRIVGASRAVRLAAPQTDGSSHLDVATVREVVASCVAPFLTAFVLWVAAGARGEELEHLYFVARDGQLLLRIADVLAEHVPMPPRSYLYGSRQAWNLPAVREASGTELEFVLLNGQSSAPRHDLARLDIRPEEIAQSLEAYGFPPATWDRQLDGQSRKRFWQVLQDRRVSALLLERAARARTGAVRYLTQEGLLSGSRWALVDVGWTMRSQRSLARLLDGATVKPEGFYVGMSKSRYRSSAYGRAHGFLVEELSPYGARTALKAIFQNRGMIDQVFTMADHGSTTGYRVGDRRVEPVLAPHEPEPRRREVVQVIHEAVADYVAEIATLAPVPQFAEELRRAGIRSLSSFLSRPSAREAKAFAWLSISDDPNELRSVKVARPLTIHDLRIILRDLIRRIERRDGPTLGAPSLFYKNLDWGFAWLEGSVALSGMPARLALACFRFAQRALEPLPGGPAWLRRIAASRVARLVSRLRRPPGREA